MASCDAGVNADELNGFYPPTVHSNKQYFSISIPVEIAEKDVKQSFIHLFERYGFSGNGPSIEQVVMTYIGENAGQYDSEGDAFYIYTTDQISHANLLNKIKCIEKLECLNKWLQNANSIIIKE